MRRLALPLAAVVALPAAAHAAVPHPVLPLGVAGWAPVLLVLAGVVLLCVELFVLPGFGVAGLLGLVAMVLGGIIALVGPFPQPVDFAIAAAAVLSSATLMGVALWGVMQRLRAGRDEAIFGGSLPRERGYLSAPHRPELEGALGTAVTHLRPAGTAEVAGERLDVVAESGWIDAGTPVRILHAEGYRHVVRADALPPADPPADADRAPPAPGA